MLPANDYVNHPMEETRTVQRRSLDYHVPSSLGGGGGGREWGEREKD